MTLTPAAGILVDGRFRLLRQLGRGGMGSVWVATQESLGRDVAIKLVDVRDPERLALARARFEREARAIAGLKHPNVVTIYDFSVDGDTPYYAMEIVEGESLRARIARGPVPWRETLSIVEGVARALRAAHAVGVIHRDVKPENVMLARAHDGGGDVVKVLDFGIAKVADPGVLAQGAALTVEGTAVGTPGFIAPETVLAGVTDDPRSDLYALGVTWFEALTGGVHPFTAATATGLVMAHATAERPGIRERAPEVVDVPPAVEALVLRLLARDASARPRDAVALLAELASLQQAGAVTTTMTAPPVTLPTPAPTTVADAAARPASTISTPASTSPTPSSPAPKRASRKLAAAAALAIVAGSLAAAAVVMRDDKPARGGSLRVAISPTNAPWTPYGETLSNERAIGERYIYEPLVRVDEAEARPAAATWEWVDERTLRLRLRAGARFHAHPRCTGAGRDATVDDLLASVTARAPSLTKAAFPYVRARADGASVAVELSEAAPRAPATLKEIYLMPAELFAQPPCDDIKSLSQPVGTGPYAYDARGSVGGVIRLVRAPSWPDDAPPWIDSLEMVPYASDKPERGLEAVTSGRVDTFWLDASKVPNLVVEHADGTATLADKRYAADFQLASMHVDVVHSSYLILRLSRPPFNDLETRRLLHAAIDRRPFWRALGAEDPHDVERVLAPGYGPPAPPTSRTPPALTREEARARLERSGALAAVDLRIATVSLAPAAEALCDDLRGLVRSCAPTKITVAEFGEAGRSDAIEVLSFNIVDNDGDGERRLRTLITRLETFGFDAERAAELRAILDRAARPPNAGTRMTLLREVERALLEEAAVIPLGHGIGGPVPHNYLVVSKRVRGIIHPFTRRVIAESPDELTLPPLDAWLAKD